MPSQDEELVKILNDLVAACRDAFADEISRIVSDMGAKPAREAHFGGILHRGWVDLETRLRGKGDAKMLRECRLGDQETLNHYQDALERAPQMPSETGVIIERHRNTIRSEIDSLRKSGASRQYGASR